MFYFIILIPHALYFVGFCLVVSLFFGGEREIRFRAMLAFLFFATVITVFIILPGSWRALGDVLRAKYILGQ